MTDNRSIGGFIASSRREKQLTQAQLGDILGVTSKAVSKWETGRSLPDVTIMEKLCETLGITISELLSGKRITPEESSDNTTSIILELIGDGQIFMMQMVIQLIWIGGLFLFMLPLLATREFLPKIDVNNVLCWILGMALVFAYSYLDRKLPMRTYRMSDPLLQVVTGIATVLVIWIPNFVKMDSTVSDVPGYSRGTLILCITGLVAFTSVYQTILALRNRRRSRGSGDQE